MFNSLAQHNRAQSPLVKSECVDVLGEVQLDARLVVFVERGDQERVASLALLQRRVDVNLKRGNTVDLNNTHRYVLRMYSYEWLKWVRRFGTTKNI